MTKFECESMRDYVDSCREKLTTMETSLLALGEAGTGTKEDWVVPVLFTVQAVKEGAGFFELEQLRELAGQTEAVLTQLDARKVLPTSNQLAVLLHATSMLHDQIDSAGTGVEISAKEAVSDLASICQELRGADDNKAAATPERLHTLIVEDDFTGRLVLQTVLSRYGECHVAVNGREAVEAFRSSVENGQHYDLICMDIMMPDMDGVEAVRLIRAQESANGIFTNRTRIIMTTALDDIKTVSQCYQELCDAYLVKPIDLAKLRHQLKDLRLIQ